MSEAFTKGFWEAFLALWNTFIGLLNTWPINWILAAFGIVFGISFGLLAGLALGFRFLDRVLPLKLKRKYGLEDFDPDEYLYKKKPP